MAGDINLSARVQWQPRNDLGQWVAQRVTPGAVAGATAWANAVLERAQEIVAVRSGELRDSGKVAVSVTERRVVARVVFASDHAGFVEFGTGRRGSAGGGGQGYNTEWPGMPSQPYLRPARDEIGPQGKDFVKREVSFK